MNQLGCSSGVLNGFINSLRFGGYIGTVKCVLVRVRTCVSVSHTNLETLSLSTLYNLNIVQQYETN
jgi:hypothetical protein